MDELNVQNQRTKNRKACLISPVELWRNPASSGLFLLSLFSKERWIMKPVEIHTTESSAWKTAEVFSSLQEVSRKRDSPRLMWNSVKVCAWKKSSLATHGPQISRSQGDTFVSEELNEMSSLHWARVKKVKWKYWVFKKRIRLKKPLPMALSVSLGHRLLAWCIQRWSPPPNRLQ